MAGKFRGAGARPAKLCKESKTWSALVRRGFDHLFGRLEPLDRKMGDRKTAKLLQNGASYFSVRHLSVPGP
jgi:hypothetical protein